MNNLGLWNFRGTSNSEYGKWLKQGNLISSNSGYNIAEPMYRVPQVARESVDPRGSSSEALTKSLYAKPATFDNSALPSNFSVEIGHKAAERALGRPIPDFTADLENLKASQGLDTDITTEKNKTGQEISELSEKSANEIIERLQRPELLAQPSGPERGPHAIKLGCHQPQYSSGDFDSSLTRGSGYLSNKKPILQYTEPQMFAPGTFKSQDTGAGSFPKIQGPRKFSGGGDYFTMHGNKYEDQSRYKLCGKCAKCKNLGLPSDFKTVKYYPDANDNEQLQGPRKTQDIQSDAKNFKALSYK